VSLRELTLTGEVDRVATALDRLRTFEPAEGYYLAFSGGKDSIVILDLAKRAGVRFAPHYHMTTVDPPELVHFIRREHPEVVCDVPAESMWQLIRRKGMLPTRTKRFCCEVLKEGHGRGVIVTGVRAAESARRARRGMVEPCIKGGARRTFLHPIIDWADAEVWEYIRERGLPYCSLYDEGWRRVGCVCCPFSDPRREAARWPGIAASYRRLANEVWSPGRDMKYQFASGDDYYEWWLSGRALENQDQLRLYE
jgi:phosphoadenosine phosphosulfate reductase